jgi:hypothetical protein
LNNIGEKIPLYAKYNNTPCVVSWELETIDNNKVGSLSTTQGTYTTFTACKIGPAKIKAVFENEIFEDIVIIVGGTITTSSKETSFTLTDTDSEITVVFSLTTSTLYTFLPKKLSKKELTNLSGNIGIGLELIAYDRLLQKYNTLTASISIHYKENNKLANMIDEESLRLYISYDKGKNWSLVENSYVNTLANVIYGTVTRLGYIGVAGKLKFAEDLKDVIVYPNPCIQGKYVYFDNLSKTAIIRIYDLWGALIHTIDAESKRASWKVDEKIASGVYIYVIKDKKGNTKLGKLAIIK